MPAPRTGDLQTIRTGAAFAPVDRGLLRITGPDGLRWLNGMVTNSVAALGPGEGNYNFLLNAQGRIQGDCLLFRDTAALGDTPGFLLASDGAQIGPLQAHLDRYIIMDDVELTPAFADESSMLLLGCGAAQLLHTLALPLLEPLHLAHADTPHGHVLLFAHPAATIPRFELRASEATLAALRSQLAAQGLPELSAEVLEQLRIWEGTPRFGADIRDRELPQETNQTQALHFAKGCYLGQEIVERIRSRGQVHRVFGGFRLEGTLPALPAPLTSAGKPAGELTSAIEVLLEDGPALLALGYARREFLDTHAALAYDGGTAHPRPLPRPV